MGARGFVHGVRDKEVRNLLHNLTGNACAWICVLGSEHTHAPAVVYDIVLPFEEDVSVDQG